MGSLFLSLQWPRAEPSPDCSGIDRLELARFCSGSKATLELLVTRTKTTNSQGQYSEKQEQLRN